MPGDEKSKQAEVSCLQTERLAGANMQGTHKSDVEVYLLIICVFEVDLDCLDDLSGH